MCYNIKSLLQTQLIRARRLRREAEARELELRLKELEIPDLHQASGFSHPRMLIYTETESLPVVATWGLVPKWVKDNDQRLKLWNNTLNARAESIFEKSSFRDAANSKRCLIYLDGFYEHHHFNGKTFPFFIQRKNAEPFAVAGLWSEWTDRENKIRLISFSIVTTSGNNLMARIHNNPKLDGPRMPVILPEELENDWISPGKSRQELSELLLPFPEELLQAHTVYRISGKDTRGNTPEAEKEYAYEELKYDHMLKSV